MVLPWIRLLSASMTLTPSTALRAITFPSPWASPPTTLFVAPGTRVFRTTPTWLPVVATSVPAALIPCLTRNGP